jgi:hypothetical protein
MGEAKRKQQQAIGTPEEFSVPDGMVAITLDIERHNPSTLMLSARFLNDFVDMAAAKLINRTYVSVIREIALGFPSVRGRDESKSEAMAIMALWSVFNHPQGGKTARKAVADALRQDGKAHITWRIGSTGLAISVAEAFFPLASVIDAQAKAGDSVVVAEFEAEPGAAPLLH